MVVGLKQPMLFMEENVEEDNGSARSTSGRTQRVMPQGIHSGMSCEQLTGFDSRRIAICDLI
jgi:hypothetical protein